MKKVAIILVNYKDYVNRFLAECRDSLRAQNYPRDLYMVYIVDNASSEESAEYIKNNYSEAKIIPRPDGNFAAANNAGIKEGIKDGCEYFVIANMDTKFAPAWLAELVKAIESDPAVGMAQSKIFLYPKNEEEWKMPKINTLGNIMHYLGFGMTSFYGELDKPHPGSTELTEVSPLLGKEREKYPEIRGYASGCSFITKKEALDKIGGYNEEYYMYHDDIEVSWKAKLAGYKIVLAPQSVVYHKYEFSRSIMMLYYMERNRYIAMFSFYKLPTLILILPALALMDIGVLFYSIAGGWLKIKLRVYGYFLKAESWRKIFKARKEIRKIRKVKDRDIVKYFTGRIAFQEVANPILKYIANPAFSLYWRIIRKIIVW